MIKERRKHPRLRIPLEAEYLVAGRDEWREGTIWTLGAGGAALLCEEELALGTRLEGLHFVVEAEGELPETRIEVGAEVVSSEPDGAFGRSANFMLGLSFQNLGEQEFELLRQFVFLRLTGGSGPSSAECAAEPQEKVVRPPIEIRFKLFDEFVEEVSENLSPTGMFIRAQRPLPPGSRFVFQFQLGDDFSLFQGMAEVVWTRRRSSDPERPPGMGVRFVRLDLTSQKMVRRLVGQREAEVAPESAEESDEPIPATVVEPAEPGNSGLERIDARQLRAATELDQARERIEQRDRELERRTEEWERLEMELREELAQRIAGEAEFQGRAERAAEAEAELRQRLEQAEGRAQELELRLERSGGTEHELERLRAESADAVQEWDAAKAELSAQLLAKSAGEQELRQRLESAGETEAELRRQLESLEADRFQQEESRERIESLESELSRVRLEAAEAAEQWEVEAAELRARLDVRATAAVEFEQRLAEAAGAEAELQRRLNEADEAREESERQAERRGQVAIGLREQAQELRGERAELAARLARAQGRLEKMRAAAAEMKSRFNGDLSAAQALEAALAGRLAEVAAVGSSLEEKVEGLNAARADLGRRLARITGAWSSLEDGLAELEQEALDAAPEAIPGAELVPQPEPSPALTAAVAAPPAADESPSRLHPQSQLAPEMETPEMGTPATEAPATEAPETEPLATEPPPAPAEAKRATGLVDAARRAVARLGFARRTPENRSGVDAAPETAPPAGLVDEGAAAAEPPAASAPPELPPPVASAETDPVAIEETVKAWAAAWSEQRVEDYLSFYSREFAAASAEDDEASGEASHAWLPPLAGMELTLGPISQTELAPGRLAVQFEQRVESDSYTRRTGRTLEMVLEADAWKIAAESFQDL